MSSLESPPRMPVLFIGHGNPMYAIEDNSFTKSLRALRKRLPRPRAVLCVSAHWMTEGTWLTRMKKPRTIHDFYGFPEALFEVQYPAPGSPEIADLIRSEVKCPPIQADEEIWGLDHGTWAVLKHLYPEAEVPVLQLSVYLSQPGAYHFEVGSQLKRLRDQGVLIVGSGNIVHNLRQIRWEESADPYEWAVQFDEWCKERLLRREFKALIEDFDQSPQGKLSHPSPDHYYPLLYTLGASDPSDSLQFEYEGIHNGSISMRCLSFGLGN